MMRTDEEASSRFAASKKATMLRFVRILPILHSRDFAP